MLTLLQSSAPASSHDQYWASLPGPAFGSALKAKISYHAQESMTSIHHAVVRRSIARYHGHTEFAVGHRVSQGGDRGHLSMVYTNHLRAFVQHAISLVAGPRVAYKVSPRNTDLGAKEEAMLANGLLQGYVRQLRLDRRFREALENALVGGEAYVRVWWDESLGDEYAVDKNGRVLKTGDVNVRVYHPFDVIRPPAAMGDEADWLIAVDYVNRFDLISDFPDLRERILAVPPAADLQGEQWVTRGIALENSPEIIPRILFYHRPSAALPQGREVMAFDDETPPIDGPLSTGKNIPVFRIAPGERSGTRWGYSPVFDMLGPLDAHNMLMSTALSNEMAFGLPNVLVPRGGGFEPHKLAGNLNLIEADYVLGKPEPLKMPETSAQIFESAQIHLNSSMQMLGLNQASMGAIPGNSRLSQDALAMLDSKAVQFASTLQGDYVHLVESVGEEIIRLLKHRVSSPRVAELVGKHERVRLRSFTGDNLRGAGRVTVQIANPLMYTPAQRMQVLQLMLEQGLIRSKEEWAEAMETGQVETILRGPRAEMMLVEEENEQILRGEQPKMLATDQHILHIQEHAEVFATPQARQDETILAAGLPHIMEHIEALGTLPPQLLQILGQVPAGPAGPPPPDQQQQQGPARPPEEPPPAATPEGPAPTAAGAPPPAESPPATPTPA